MKIALFFGSFNPVHIGHVALANYVAEYGNVDKVMMIVSPLNPLKAGNTLLPNEVRLNMLRKAVEGYSKIEVSDVEFGLPIPSYTYDTLEYLRREHPEHEYILLMGADNVEVFSKWRNYDKILEKYHIMVYPRRGYTDELPYNNMSRIETPIIEVSSTFIRESVEKGRDVRFFLPGSIYDDVCREVKKMKKLQ